MELIYFTYTSKNKLKGMCKLEVYRKWKGVIIVATEMPNNPGQSITNTAETIATQFLRKYNISPQGMTWIEHYDEEQVKAGHIIAESFARVHFEFDWLACKFINPTWVYVSPETYRRLIS